MENGGALVIERARSYEKCADSSAQLKFCHCLSSDQRNGLKIFTSLFQHRQEGSYFLTVIRKVFWGKPMLFAFRSARLLFSATSSVAFRFLRGRLGAEFRGDVPVL